MNHNCVKERIEHLATEERPFHFEDSGLSNIYLVGIRYFTCECGRMVADIPAIKQLMQFIARDLVEKQTGLTGEELRFLRKRLGQKQIDFARAIGIEPETLSRYENNKQDISESNNKLIRLYYAVSAWDDSALAKLRTELYELLSGWHEGSHASSKKTVARVTDDEWKLQAG